MPRLTKDQLIKACEGKSARSGGLNKEDLVDAIVRRVPRANRPHVNAEGDIVDSAQGKPLTSAQFKKELMAYQRSDLSDLCLIYGYIPGTWPPEGPQGETAKEYYGSTTVRQRKKYVFQDVSEPDNSDADDDLFTFGPKAKVSNKTRTERACLGFSESRGGMNKQQLIETLVTKIPKTQRPIEWQDNDKLRMRLNRLPRTKFDTICARMGLDIDPLTEDDEKEEPSHYKIGGRRKSVMFDAAQKAILQYFYDPSLIPTGIEAVHAVYGHHYPDIRKSNKNDRWTLGFNAAGLPTFMKVA